jgi:hypothetical protein
MSPKTLAAFLVLILAACNGSSDVKTEKTKEDPNLPPAQVSLPSPPPESAYQIPEKNPDGTFRVEGLIHNRDKYLDQQVEVKGIIVRLSEECDPKKAKRAGEECPEPNLFIRDNAEAESAMRVVGYDDDFVKKAKLEEGQERVFKGTYQKVAQGFVATEDGMILLDYVDDIAVLEED